MPLIAPGEKSSTHACPAEWSCSFVRANFSPAAKRFESASAPAKIQYPISIVVDPSRTVVVNRDPCLTTPPI